MEVPRNNLTTEALKGNLYHPLQTLYTPTRIRLQRAPRFESPLYFRNTSCESGMGGQPTTARRIEQRTSVEKELCGQTNAARQLDFIINTNFQPTCQENVLATCYNMSSEALKLSCFGPYGEDGAPLQRPSWVPFTV